MARSCDLEVEVNGQEIFFVDKKIISSFSGRLNKLFNKTTTTAKTLKVIFYDLPGGAEAFELMVRFCYNNGTTHITTTNICLLHCVAHFMEMSQNLSNSSNLIEQTEKFLKGITYWTWSEILIALKQCQDFFPMANSSGILQKLLDSLIVRMASTSDMSPSSSSPESSGLRFSCDTRSTESVNNSYYRSWWFEDLGLLNSATMEKAIQTMVSRKFDHAIISRFLLYCLKSRFSGATVDERCKITETVVDLLFSLDRCCVSCKGLFGILRVASGLNISKSCRNRLECMIGSQFDQATLDNLLIPSPVGINYLYDVNLVLRFLKSFLSDGGCRLSLTQLRRVGSLIDMYMAEVAPDPCLKPSKFVALAVALPDLARDSYDGIYRAMDIYLEVHTGLSEEKKMMICCALNYEKLSAEACKHLAENSKFPSKSAIQALISQQSKLKSLLHETNHLKPFAHSPDESKREKDNHGEQVVLYAQKLDLSKENEQLKANLQGMQWRVVELEKVCRKMQNQIAKMMKARLSTPSNSRSLPKMCS